ncbi:hypothetical protein FNH22_11455 [Fulvivirga sp. M361]|uniref:hypothetical protein n=1 Tax=Fulvivirga sp. M361 TaxID=2594266 RepID=UPI00117A12A3|nr:hypothetical protein [Fulvivirga sp. M361]TRX59132.1 hypothetical protein FNH22_11455 [Fulvivirga sp. M361]
MEKYWVNNWVDSNPNKDHEVHKEGCQHLPLKNGLYLGEHPDYYSALREAEEYLYEIDACEECIEEFRVKSANAK